MTTYTTIPNSDIDQDSPVTQELVTLIRDNPIATAEGSTDAPVLSAGWHPYDMVNVGDGADGKFYDFATDGSGVGQITPDFEDGYEYMIIMRDMTFNLGGEIRIDYYKATDAAYHTGIYTSSSFASGKTMHGQFHIPFPRITSRQHVMRNIEAVNDGTSTYGDMDGSFFDGTLQKISKVRCTVTTATARTGGTMYLYRRREFISG